MAVARLQPDYGRNGAVAEVGQVISGKYKLLRLLGEGGMGSVYEAEHLVLGTRVAIKVLHSDIARRAGLNDRFLQEARVSAQIRSPHVVQVTDVDRTPEGVAYLVMELLQGETLSSVVKREQRMQVKTACEYTLQILLALEAAHALGVIHRDLKPENVFVTFQGGRAVIKLIDFGIAKLKSVEGVAGKNLTVAGMLMGTPEYMAPEQAYSAAQVDVRADLYAVGVMLYEMLAGRTPVSGDDARIVVLTVERGEVTPLVHAAPGTPPELAGLVHRAMAPRPELRFANASEMRIALEAVMSGKRPGTAPIPGVAPRPVPAAGNPRPEEIGTGTVMGAPVAAALVDGKDGQGGGGGTAHAPPLDPQMARAVPPGPPGGGHGGHPLPPPQPSLSYEPTRPPPPRRRGGGGLVVALAIVALLLGAGAVVAYVLGTGDSASTPPPSPFDTPVITEPTPTTPPRTPGTDPPPLTTAPPLTTSPQRQPQPQPQPQAKPPPTKPPTTADAGPAPPATAPTTPPPFTFPSAIPLPSGFPSAFPLPSGFPTLWPPPPPPPGE
jgi:eukaryotic-like serine/threonine-protein kinase